jgi:hypothetical protein
MQISQQEVTNSAARAVATLNASRQVAQMTAAQLAQERAGQMTSGPGAFLVGGSEPVAR